MKGIMARLERYMEGEENVDGEHKEVESSQV